MPQIFWGIICIVFIWMSLWTTKVFNLKLNRKILILSKEGGLSFNGLSQVKRMWWKMILVYYPLVVLLILKMIKKKLVWNVHRLARLGVHLVKSTKVVLCLTMVRSRHLWLPSKVLLDPILVELMEAVFKKFVESFSQREILY